jgi:signal transduction histidine kinase
VPRLIVIHGVDEGREFDLQGPTLGIGRDSSNGIHIHDTEVSRRHAELRITLDGSSYRLLDRSSANGVYVNGQAIREVVLQGGDRIQIGQTVLVFSGNAPPSDRADRIRMVAAPDERLRDSIVHTVAEEQGSRILSRPEDAHSPWLRTRLANLATLYEASQAISQILDVDQLLGRILELAFQSIEADRGCFLLNGEGGLQPKAVLKRKPDRDAQLTISRTITDYVLKNHEGILVSDAARDRRFDPGQSIIRTGIREAICVPMKGRHDTVGVLYLDTISQLRPGAQTSKFTEDHLSLAIALAHQAALAVEDARHRQALVQAERLAAVGQTIAALSHHIKNILQGLRSGTEILNVGLRDKDDALLHQAWKLIDKNQARIYDLVLDMLSFSKEREPTLEPTDLNSLVGDVVEMTKSRAEEIGATVTVNRGELPTVQTDAVGIHRAVLNLMSNALDAVTGRPNPSVTISTSCKHGSAQVVVRDNGVGISSEQMPDLFKPFISSKGSRGTGLGLAVSRKIVREHGGDITVESEPGVGSTFNLRLPMRAEPMSETTTGPPPPAE